MYAKKKTFISCVLCSFGYLLKNVVKRYRTNMFCIHVMGTSFQARHI